MLVKQTITARHNVVHKQEGKPPETDQLFF